MSWRNWLPRAADSSAALDDFIDQAYRALLQRRPDDPGRAAYRERLRRREITPAGVLRELAASDEYLALQRAPATSSLAAAIESRVGRDPQLEQRLQHCTALDRAVFDRCCTELFEAGRELVIGQQDYVIQHRQRFWELFNAVAILAGDRRPLRLLEFGASEFSGVYRRLWPGIALELADRPVDDSYPGFNRHTSMHVSGAGAFHAVDLNRPGALLDDGFRHLHARFDLVVFAEVLEHLTANPVDLLRQLLALLSPEGFLYLTTPNFFRHENLLRIARRENPQEVYPPGDDNWDLHHHYREYAAAEMLDFIDQAGGVCKALVFSACWDDPSQVAPDPLERGNMVFAITPKASNDAS